MRLVTPGDSAPASIHRYLLPHEHQVITVRRHPAILMKPVSFVLGGLIIAGVLSNQLSEDGRAVVSWIWWGWLILLGWFVWKVAEWSVDYFIITNQRMLLTYGIITRKVAMMPLAKVTDMNFQRSVMGRMLGYGEFILESAGQDQALHTVGHLPYPEQLYLEVCSMIFPDRTNAPGERDKLREKITEQRQRNGDLRQKIETYESLSRIGQLESEGDRELHKFYDDLRERVDRLDLLTARLEDLEAAEEGTRRRRTLTGPGDLSDD